MSGRQQRGAPVDRSGDDGKGKGLDNPHYRVTDQDWKMSDFPDPLLPRPDLSMSLPPDMDRDTERGLWAYLQNQKDRARQEDEKKARAKVG
ncbi:hypothetical protein VUR80DRAFT_6792 [Thermomyces stellatus]